MKDFDIIYWGFVFSSIGIALGWLLTQVSQWFKGRKDNKRELKFVLFNLLETYFLFTRTDTDFILKIAKKEMLKIIPSDVSQEVENAIDKILPSLIKKMFDAGILEELKVVQQSYDDSLKGLAYIDPIMAYYLRGKTDIVEQFENLKTIIEAEDVQHAGIAIDSIKPNFIGETMKDLESDIKKIALKINPWTRIKVMKVIKRAQLSNHKEEEISEMMQSLINPAKLVELTSQIAGVK